MEHLTASIIIPTYNRAALVPRAVASVLATLEPGDEVIVVDDGSTDATASALAPYHNRIRSIKTENRGAGAARNTGILHASNPLVAFLDSDDEWMPDKLYLQRALMAAQPDVLFSITDMILRYDTGGKHRHELANWHRDPRSWDEILGPGIGFSTLAPLPPGREDFSIHIGDLYADGMERGYMATSTLVVRREAAGEALRFAEDVPTAEDRECFARLARRGPAAYLDCETVVYWARRIPRLTNAGLYAVTVAQRTILERNWGRDEAFLAKHGDRYARVLAAKRVALAQWLILEGRASEARAELRAAGGGTVSQHLLASLPDGPLPRLLGRSLYATRRARPALARLRALCTLPFLLGGGGWLLG